MKKLILSITIMLIFISSVQAEKIKGQILYQDDTINVIMKIPVKLISQESNYEKIQYKIKYFDSDGLKKSLKPHEAQEIRFSYYGKDVRMLSRINTISVGIIQSMSSHIFLKLEIDGYLKLFEYHFTQRSPGMYNASTGMATGGHTYNVEKFILQKGNESLKRPRGLAFRKDMSEYFNDYPNLSDKIQEKTLRNKDIKLIVRDYNQECR